MSEKPESLRLTEPEALRVADGLEGKHSIGYQPYAAAELRRLHAENERLRDELKEDTGVIAVWRGRTERAESENERLREALRVCLAHWFKDDNPDELQENVAKFKELCGWENKR